MTERDFTNMSGKEFERIEMNEARFRDVDLTGARFERVNLSGAVLRGMELFDVKISGQIHNLTINGVDVAPLVNAELDRRFPDRAKMRPTDAAGFREAWDLVERLWDGMVTRPGGCGRNCCTSGSTGSGRSSRHCVTWCSPQTPGSGG
jgi:hypothetical protein